jgi:hypothetical protein
MEERPGVVIARLLMFLEPTTMTGKQCSNVIYGATQQTEQRNRRSNATTNSSAFVIFLPLIRHFTLHFYMPLVDESLVLQAATAYRNGEYTSIRACADAFSVSYSTLSY